MHLFKDTSWHTAPAGKAAEYPSHCRYDLRICSGFTLSQVTAPADVYLSD